ncbi:MAG: BrnT family toxin [Beijerinckiaceae bacterium]
MEFAWDEGKRRSNLAKHGLDFADVYPAFFDAKKTVVEDIRSDYGEVRYNMLAKLHGRICHVTFTERNEVVWLISARKANQREQKRYGQL